MPFFGIPIRNGLPIGLGSVAGFGVAPEFSPADLFLGGVNGAWYDPSDSTTLFSDTAGTTPVAQPGAGAQVVVGAMLDERAPSYSNYFDGTGDYLSLVDNAALEPGSSDLTWEMWINTSATAQYTTLYSREPSIYASGMWALQINQSGASSGNVAIYIWDFNSGVNAPILSSSGAGVCDNAWHHIAVVRNGSAWALYIDGVSRATNTWSGTIADISGAPAIGYSQNYGRNYTGYISNLRIVKGTAVYTANFTPPTGPLTAITGTSLLTCGNSWSGNPAITVSGNTRVDGLNPFVASPVGNHAISYNSTTARPELSARVNLLTYSEDFSAARGWQALSGAVLTADYAPNPLGTANNAARVQIGAGVAERIERGFTGATVLGVAYKQTIYIKSNTGSNQVVGLREAPGATNTLVTATSSWTQVTNNFTAAGANAFFQIVGSGLAPGASASIDVQIAFADLRPANIGANVPAYQRIADQYTYDNSASFPRYLRFDGVDDGMSTPANLNLSSTDKATVFAGVRYTGASANNSLIAELSADLNANNGVFDAWARLAASSFSYAFVSKGTTSAIAGAGLASYTPPISNVFTGIGNIAGDVAELRLNGAVAATNAGDQGTGNYGTYPLYIGARNNGSLWLNGNIYSLIVRGAATDASTISATETWVAGKTGITI